MNLFKLPKSECQYENKRANLTKCMFLIQSHFVFKVKNQMLNGCPCEILVAKPSINAIFIIFHSEKFVKSSELKWMIQKYHLKRMQ